MREVDSQRIDRRVNAQLGDLAAQHRRGVQMGERRGRSRVGQVVGRHVDRLHGGNGPFLGRGDPLLHRAHFGSQRRLVADGRRHAAQQGRHLRSGLRETEYVIDKEQNVLGPRTGIAERFGHRQPRQSHRAPGSGRLVHLAEHERRLRFLDLGVIDLRQVPLALLHAFV